MLDRDTHLIPEDYADKKFLELHDTYTDDVKDIAYSLRGFYLKNAQYMSTQDDFIPSAYMNWMKDTQDNVPSDFQQR